MFRVFALSHAILYERSKLFMYVLFIRRNQNLLVEHLATRIMCKIKKDLCDICLTAKYHVYMLLSGENKTLLKPSFVLIIAILLIVFLL